MALERMKAMRMLVVHIGKTFQNRVAEWFLADVLFNFGWVLVQPDELFDRSASYGTLSAMADEYYWGCLFILIGGLRLIALVVNGYWVPATFHMRSVFSFLSLFAWSYIAFGTFKTGYAISGMAFWPPTVALELYCLYRTARDYRAAVLLNGWHKL